MQQRITPKILIVENKRRDYGRVRRRKYALEAIIKLLFISLFHDKCLLFMLELY